ncbi:MAG: four-carbon acid sugar kinase family protein [Clostridiales bacterium]|nr:four-carbon acid sugar kinase family protein [Clostridiales bacterium]
MAFIGAVTDDFTGTASAGVLVARSGARTGLFFDAVSLREFKEADKIDAIYVSSNSRHLDPKSAYQVVAETTDELKKSGVKYFSKKIDTTLRGGIGYEIDAMLETLGKDMVAVMVTAMPASRRICVGGHSIIDGTILTETPIAQDIKTPVKNCYVPELIREQSKYPVDLIPLKEILKGVPHIKNMLCELREKGARIIIADAITMDHIDLIARACVELGWDILAVDPGPFTMKLALHRELIHEERSADNQISEIRRDKTALFIVGSANPSTKTQIEKLCDLNQHVVQISVSPIKLIEGNEAMQEINQIADKVIKLLHQPDKPEAIVVETALHDVIVDLDKEDIRRNQKHGTSSNRINEGLALITEKILAEVGRDPIAGLMLTGGDTMERVCRQIGVSCIEAKDNIVAQVDVGRIMGKYDGLPIIVKGGFCGYETVAADIVERLFIEASR